MSRMLRRALLTLLAVALLASVCLASDETVIIRYDAYPWMPDSPLKSALKSFDAGQYHDIREILARRKDPEARMLKGMAYCGLMNYVRCASDLERFVEGYEGYSKGQAEYEIYRRTLGHAAEAFEKIGEKNKALLTRRRMQSLPPPVMEPGSVSLYEIEQVESQGKGYDLGLKELPGLVIHKDIALKIAEGSHNEAQMMLRGMEDPHSYLLRGVAHYELKEYEPAARELSAFTVLDESDKALRVFGLKRLMHAYYHSDQLVESLETSSILIDELDGPQEAEVALLQKKIRRELKGNSTRVSESSDHFKTVFDGYVHGDLNRFVLSVLEDAYRDVGREFDLFPLKRVTVVLDTKSTFHDITRSPRWAGGIFKDGRIRLPVDGIDTIEKGEVSRVLRHEYVHALVFSIAEDCPRWLHEGLAEYFSRGPSAASGKPSVSLSVLDSYFMSGSVLIIASAYKESFLAVKALIERYGIYSVKQYVEAIGRGEAVKPAFERIFNMKHDSFVLEMR